MESCPSHSAQFSPLSNIYVVIIDSLPLPIHSFPRLPGISLLVKDIESPTMQPRRLSYVFSSPGVLGRCGAKQTSPFRRRNRCCRSERFPRMSDSQPPSNFTFPSAQQSDFVNRESTADDASATAQALFEDLAYRPEYYLNVAGVLLGIALSCVVLSATMTALESIPFLPDLLKVIGLAYLFWFLNKFLFSATERERLGGDISSFVTGVRGTDSSQLNRIEDV